MFKPLNILPYCLLQLLVMQTPAFAASTPLENKFSQGLTNEVGARCAMLLMGRR